jgi:cytochrome P450
MRTGPMSIQDDAVRRTAALVYEPLRLDLDQTALLFAPAGEPTHADPPLHTRLRNAIKWEFGVSAVRNRLEETVRAEVRHLIGELHGRERVDLAQELALPLPAGVICGWLGLPAGDHPQLIRWFEAMLERAPGKVELQRPRCGREMKCVPT